jgi:hypothetical protein
MYTRKSCKRSQTIGQGNLTSYLFDYAFVKNSEILMCRIASRWRLAPGQSELYNFLTFQGQGGARRANSLAANAEIGSKVQMK